MITSGKRGLLVYGATGYSGRMVARAVLALRGSRAPQEIVFAGRNVSKLKALERDLGLSEGATKVLDLTDDDALDEHCGLARVVLNLAGPFPATAPRLAKAAIRNGAHYMDISGEFEVFRYLDNFSKHARDRSLFIMPGAGYSVVATDLLANFVLAKFKERHPQIDERDMTLRIALSGIDHLSRGSVNTALNAAREGVPIRRNGTLSNRPVGAVERVFNFDGRERLCSAVRLPDVVTAFKSTEIPNIETYCATAPLERAAYQIGAELAVPMQIWPWRGLLQRHIRTLPEGPTEDARMRMRPMVIAEIEDRYRRTVAAQWKTIDPYAFTANCVAAILGKIYKNTTTAVAFGTTKDHFGFVSPTWALLDGPPSQKRDGFDWSKLCKSFSLAGSTHHVMEVRGE